MTRGVYGAKDKEVAGGHNLPVHEPRTLPAFICSEVTTNVSMHCTLCMQHLVTICYLPPWIKIHY